MNRYQIEAERRASFYRELVDQGNIQMIDHCVRRTCLYHIEEVCERLLALLMTMKRKLKHTEKLEALFEFILANGGKTEDSYGQSILELAVRQRSDETVDYLIRTCPFNVAQLSAALTVALQRGRGRVAIELRKRGALIEHHFDDAMGPVGLCVRSGKKWLLRWCLREGGNPNELCFRTWKSPLLLCAEYGYTDIAEILLDHGADPNLLSELSSSPALWIAVLAKNLPMVSLLLRRGADPNFHNKHGFYTMHIALRDIRIVRELIAYGASATVTNNCGYTPLQTSLIGATLHGNRIQTWKELHSLGFDFTGTAHHYVTNSCDYQCVAELCTLLRFSHAKDDAFLLLTRYRNADLPKCNISIFLQEWELYCQQCKKDNLALLFFKRQRLFCRDILVEIQRFLLEPSFMLKLIGEWLSA